MTPYQWVFANAAPTVKLAREDFDVFDLYPRHGHRTPQQIAEDSGGSFEPTPPSCALAEPSRATTPARELSPHRSDPGSRKEDLDSQASR